MSHDVPSDSAKRAGSLLIVAAQVVAGHLILVCITSLNLSGKVGFTVRQDQDPAAARLVPPWQQGKATLNWPMLKFLRRLRPTRTTGFRSTGLMKEGPKTLFMLVFGELCLFLFYFGFICYILALFVVK